MGCKSVQKMFNMLSMTEHFTFTKFLQCYQHEAAKQWILSASGNPESHNNVQMHEFKDAEGDICGISHLTLQMQRRKG